jgi:putative DNA primase/helicase
VNEIATVPSEGRTTALVPNDDRPSITLKAGDTERIVNESEAALINAGRGLYQRANQIVFVGDAPALAAHGKEITTQRILERGEHALLEDLSIAAHFEKYHARAKEFITVDPPLSIVQTLRERVGRLKFPILSGIINAPTLREDGSILSKTGYDVATGLLFDPLGVEFPAIPHKPTRADAQKAYGLLLELIGTFDFVEEYDRSVALSAMLTACVRRSLPTAPAHVFTAPVAGSGKSKLVDIASVFATGHEAAVIAQGHTDEEFEKRLGSMLLAGDAVVSIDNCERPLGGDLLCQMLTQTIVRTRILGESKTPDVSTSVFVAATGNNLVLVGDLTRRALQCRLDPKVERPESRVFDRDPVDTAKADRGRYVVAALTILRAFHVAGRPDAPPTLGSFEAWSSLVRGALLWVGAADPVLSMNDLRKADPRLDDLTSVMCQWREVIGQDHVTAAQVVKRATEMRADLYGGGGTAEFVHADFREVLLAVAGQGGAVNTRKLGNWLTARKDRIVGGMCFRQEGIKGGVAVWSLRKP